MNGTTDWVQVRDRLRASERSSEAAVELPAERMEAVYRQRALRLAGRGHSDLSQTNLQVLVFALSAERYGLEIADVAGVIGAASITPVPGAPPNLSGVINVRGDIRPVLDLHRLLGIPAGQDDGSGWVVLLRQLGPPIGLKVDRVEQVQPVPLQELLPAGEKNMELAGRYLKGVTRDTLILLNAEALAAEFSTNNTTHEINHQ